ncbi:MAG: hypothetical protein E7189_02700 [Erysipelotrichaceae bacterium]|nr:hypothetical protein [Lachnospiraceae bacterium]MBE6119336.1 hypothetical protein [Erysipelotrichaceae bacterium]
MENEKLVILVTEHGTKITQCEKRIKVLEGNTKDIQDLALSVQELAMSVKAMVEEQKEQNLRIAALEKEPADEWKNLKRQIVNTVIGVVVGAAISGILTYILSN